MGFAPPFSAEAPKTPWSGTMMNAGLPDPPLVFDLSASNDTWSEDEGILQNIALDARLPLVVGWGPFGHTGSYSPVAKYPGCAALLALPWMEIRKNEAYPVFTRASTDERPPWSNPPGKTDESGQINGYFRWKCATDMKSEVVMRLWLEHPKPAKAGAIAPDESVADVSLRRLQQFKVSCDHSYEWQLIRGKTPVASGTITPDEAGLLTIPRVIITADPTELRVKHK